MKTLLNHPDGVVYLYNENQRYIATVSEFAADMSSIGLANPLQERPGFFQYDMPAGFSEISPVGCYGPVTTGRWEAGEAAIKAAGDLLAAQDARAGNGLVVTP